jgi:hypothetical protein
LVASTFVAGVFLIFYSAIGAFLALSLATYGLG